MDIIILNKNSEDCPEGEYIGRGSPLGNPYFFGESQHKGAKYKVKDRKEAIEKYEKYLRDKIAKRDNEICAELNRLYYKLKKEEFLNLICYCAPLMCHGHIIKKILFEVINKYES